jgi:hypothetical protein
MAPFVIEEILGKTGAVLVYLGIGIAFGAVLEMAGFANSRRLAAQFYFKDMTVLKVMFTAIVTAMVLLFAASGVGFLDYGRVFVNPTYLLPGVAGGLIMGVGFIVGGFCPGTSLVALANLKIDGLFFFAGLSAGILLFGETVGLYAGLWNSTSMGRFTLPELFGIPTGAVVVLAVLMALFMFWGGEKLERKFGPRVAEGAGAGPARSAERASGRPRAPRRVARRSWAKLAGAAALLAAALAVYGIGQPSARDRWERLAPEKETLLRDRLVQIHPGEVVALSQDRQVDLVLLDVRSEAEFNVFHLIDARRADLGELEGGRFPLRTDAPRENTVLVLMSNGEARATEAWKLLVAQGVPNVYILDGGINRWLDVFGHDGHDRCAPGAHPGEALRHAFDAARGADQSGADPDAHAAVALEYTPKVKLEVGRKLGGGCG